MLRITSLGLLGLLFVGCGDDDAPPLDVSGEYTIAVTNHENGCMFADWMEGNTASGIPLSVTQSGTEITGEVGGAAGALFTLLLGSNVLEGALVGNQLEMMRAGTMSAVEGGCSYRLNATVIGTLEGDFLEGDILYTFDTNPSPDCDFRDTCMTRQAFNGTRPPR